MTDLLNHYADYYARHDETPERDIAARAKARNVIRLYRQQLGTHAPVGHVADLGCGEGAVLHALDRAGFGTAFTGFEISPSALVAAQARTFQMPVEWRLFDGAHIAVPDAAFDVALLSHVVEHLSDPRALIAEALRIARVVAIEVPLEHHWRQQKHFQWNEVGHINFYTPDTIRWLIESARAPEVTRVLREQVRAVDRDAFVFRCGRVSGSLRWAIKAGLLTLARPLALRLFTYHATLLATAH